MNLINSEEKLRLVLQMVVVVALWMAGEYPLAILLFISLLPWTAIYPLFRLIRRAGGWMAEPLADQIKDPEELVGAGYGGRVS